MFSPNPNLRGNKMNCFNIREIQGNLKRKFFTDLINTHDHRDLLNSSMIGLRFKSNSNLNLDLDIISFYNYGLHNINFGRMAIYNNNIINKNLLNTFRPLMNDNNLYFSNNMIYLLSIDFFFNYIIFFINVLAINKSSGVSISTARSLF